MSTKPYEVVKKKKKEATCLLLVASCGPQGEVWALGDI